MTSDLYARRLGRARECRAKEGIKTLRAHVVGSVELLRDDLLPALERLATTEHEQAELLLGDEGNDAFIAIAKASDMLGDATMCLLKLAHDLSWALDECS